MTVKYQNILQINTNLHKFLGDIENKLGAKFRNQVNNLFELWIPTLEKGNLSPHAIKGITQQYSASLQKTIDKLPVGRRSSVDPVKMFSSSVNKLSEILRTLKPVLMSDEIQSDAALKPVGKLFILGQSLVEQCDRTVKILGGSPGAFHRWGSNFKRSTSVFRNLSALAPKSTHEKTGAHNQKTKLTVREVLEQQKKEAIRNAEEARERLRLSQKDEQPFLGPEVYVGIDGKSYSHPIDIKPTFTAMKADEFFKYQSYSSEGEVIYDRYQDLNELSAELSDDMGQRQNENTEDPTIFKMELQ
ncbi:MAG TPA: hypothetical protein QF353_03875 [Gammaproteobacteria bacterium]|nr:hypothetical protein [Gammaproteobacteria bacterium]